MKNIEIIMDGFRLAFNDVIDAFIFDEKDSAKSTFHGVPMKCVDIIVEDEKYYYFETPMARKLAEITLNHLEFDVGNRGKWRKFNPYNPYIDGQEEKAKDLKVESLDDLFDDVPGENNTTLDNDINNNQDMAQDNHSNIQNTQEDTHINQEVEAPILPQDEQESSEEDELSMDVQQELEAKFDELFGAFEDE